MQRWILAAVVFVMILGAAGYGGYKMYMRSRTVKIEYQLDVSGYTPEQRKSFMETLKRELGDTACLTRIARDSGFTTALQMPSDAEAAADLAKRLFVEPGTVMRASDGVSVPSVTVGVRFKGKEWRIMPAVSERLGEELKPLVPRARH